MTSPTPSVNYSGSATGINAEFDFDYEMPSSRQPEPKSPSIQEIEQPNSEEPKPKRAKSTTSDVWKSFTKIGMVDGKERARCNGCQKEYTVVRSLNVLLRSFDGSTKAANLTDGADQPCSARRRDRDRQPALLLDCDQRCSATRLACSANATLRCLPPLAL
nr:zinc finger BED domain-containing protein RICESLEEPER 2-like [Ipomoea batatas]